VSCSGDHPSAVVTFDLPVTLEDVRVVVRNEIGIFVRESSSERPPLARLEASPTEWAMLRAMSMVDGDAWMVSGLTMGRNLANILIDMTEEHSR
jgi:hypothetical protein